MRSRSTNILQIIVLISGIVYIIIGLGFYISPLWILKLFAEFVSESWFDLVRDNELVAPLYYISRGFAALVLTSGIAMILPLFDPLRYRGLMYYNGLVFPILAAALFMKNGIYFIFMKKQPGTEVVKSTASNPTGHLILLILGIIFTLIFLMFLIGLIITKKEAGKGVE